MEIAKGNFRKDLGIFVRSKMEANVARYYNYAGILWKYECQEFEFKGIKRGSRFYKPDFYLPGLDQWVEVKGWFRKTDKTKLRRFKKYFPKEFRKMYFVIPDKYSKSKSNGEMIEFLCDDLKVDFELVASYVDMEEWSGLIPGWE